MLCLPQPNKRKFKTGNNEQETVILICITINYCYEATLRFEMYIISIEEIERSCEKPMKALGYAKFDSSKKTEDQNILIKTADELWPYFSSDTQQP